MAESQQNVLLVTFPDNPSAAYEAFSKVNGLASVDAAAIVTRDANGQLSLPESTRDTNHGFWTGSVIGALIGILAGPLGVLLGWWAGAAIGSTYDVEDAIDDTDSLAVLSRAIRPGTNVLLVQAAETEPAVLDTILGPLGGKILRTPASEISAEVEEARQQQKDAAAAALKTRADQRRQHASDKRDAFTTKIHDLFHHH